MGCTVSVGDGTAIEVAEGVSIGNSGVTMGNCVIWGAQEEASTAERQTDIAIVLNNMASPLLVDHIRRLVETNQKQGYAVYPERVEGRPHPCFWASPRDFVMDGLYGAPTRIQ
jgi:hypothetical protein